MKRRGYQATMGIMGFVGYQENLCQSHVNATAVLCACLSLGFDR